MATRGAVPRLVLDTNVLLSALLFPSGSVTALRHAWQAGDITPVMSRETAEELIRVLAYPKFKLGPDDREDLLADILPWCEMVTVPDGLSAPHCRDPHDIKFLLLALAAKADALVTGDRDLLALEGSFPTPIVTPARFIEDWAHNMS